MSPAASAGVLSPVTICSTGESAYPQAASWRKWAAVRSSPRRPAATGRSAGGLTGGGHYIQQMEGRERINPRTTTDVTLAPSGVDVAVFFFQPWRS